MQNRLLDAPTTATISMVSASIQMVHFVMASNWSKLNRNKMIGDVFQVFLIENIRIEMVNNNRARK